MKKLLERWRKKIDQKVRRNKHLGRNIFVNKNSECHLFLFSCFRNMKKTIFGRFYRVLN